MAVFTRTAYEHERTKRSRVFNQAKLVGIPVGADDALGLRGERRQPGLLDKIRVESPFAGGWVVILAGLLPIICRILAGKHDDDGAVIPKVDIRPILQQTEKIFQPAAIRAIG